MLAHQINGVSTEGRGAQYGTRAIPQCTTPVARTVRQKCLAHCLPARGCWGDPGPGQAPDANVLTRTACALATRCDPGIIYNLVALDFPNVNML